MSNLNLPPDDSALNTWLLQQTANKQNEDTPQGPDKKETTRDDHLQTVTQNRNVSANVKADQTKTGFQDTIDRSAQLSQTFSKETMSSQPGKPNLDPPNEGELARMGKGAKPTLDQTENKTLTDLAKASNVMQENSQTLLKGADKNLTKQVFQALSNPEAKVPPEAKQLADNIVKQSVDTLMKQAGVSPEQAGKLIEQGLGSQRDQAEYTGAGNFNDAFDSGLKGLSTEDQTQLNFAKNNPEYAQFLSDDLQSTYNDLNEKAGELPPSQVGKEEENFDLPFKVRDNYMNKLTEGVQKGDLTEKDANQMRALFDRPQLGLPDEIKNASAELLKDSYNEAMKELTGLDNPEEADKSVFKSANDFIEKFRTALLEKSPPLSEETKKSVEDFLFKRDFSKVSDEVKKVFDEAMSKTLNELGLKNPPSPLTLRRADAFYKEITKGDASAFAAMRQSLGTPFGKAASLGDHLDLINKLEKFMKTHHISSKDAESVIAALKSSGTPPEQIKKLVQQLLKKVGPAVISERGLPEDWAPDPAMIAEAQELLKIPQNVIANNAMQFLEDQMEQIHATSRELYGVDFAAVDTGDKGGTTQGTPGASPGPAPSPGVLSNIAFLKIVSQAKENYRVASVTEMISNTKAQSELEFWQRQLNAWQTQQAQEAVTDQSGVDQTPSKKHGPVAKFFHGFKEGFRLVIKLIVEPVNTIAQLAYDPKAALTDSIGQTFIDTTNDLLKACGINSPVVQEIMDAVILVVGMVMTGGVLVNPFMVIATIVPLTVECINNSNLSQSQKNLAIDITKGVFGIFKALAMIAITVVLNLIPGVGEAADAAESAELEEEVGETQKAVKAVKEATTELEPSAPPEESGTDGTAPTEDSGGTEEEPPEKSGSTGSAGAPPMATIESAPDTLGESIESTNDEITSMKNLKKQLDKISQEVVKACKTIVDAGLKESELVEDFTEEEKVGADEGLERDDLHAKSTPSEAPEEGNINGEVEEKPGSPSEGIDEDELKKNLKELPPTQLQKLAKAASWVMMISNIANSGYQLGVGIKTYDFDQAKQKFQTDLGKVDAQLELISGASERNQQVIDLLQTDNDRVSNDLQNFWEANMKIWLMAMQAIDALTNVGKR